MLELSQGMLSGASALNAAVVVNTRYVGATIYTSIIRWGAGTTAGEVAIEVSDDPNYAGTWVELTTIAWSAASVENQHSFSGAPRAIRHRIKVAIVGGTVDSVLRGVS